MKRRTFIKASAVSSLPIFLNGMPVGVMDSRAIQPFINAEDDRILVLVQLNGGNDGLNTLIPLDQYDNLAEVRGNILIPQSQLLKLDDKHALHTSMDGFRRLYDEGKLSVIQSVAYPDQNRSHFRSKDIWTSGSDASAYIRTGWLGRYFTHFYPDYPQNYPNDDYPDPFAITLGSVVSETCQGFTSNFSYTLNDPSNLSGVEKTEDADVGSQCYQAELAHIKNTIRQTNAYSGVLLEAYEKGNNISGYPDDNSLATQLGIVARLIAGGLKTKVYVVSIGGFDTHANQVESGSPATGAHATLLEKLSAAIYAFQQDCEALNIDRRVLGMTFSEFGRRIRANFSLGTDHGTAAPMFVFGHCVNGGIIGENPVIDRLVGESEGVPMQYDFRSVYATVLKDWFDAPEGLVREVMFKDFQYLPFLRDCQSPNSTYQPDISSIDANVFPNPASDYCNIEFDSKGGKVNIAIFDDRGALMKTVLSRKLAAQRHQVQVRLDDNIRQGIYFVRISELSRVKTMKLVVM